MLQGENTINFKVKYLFAFNLACLPACLRACMLACLHACMPACLPLACVTLDVAPCAAGNVSSNDATIANAHANADIDDDCADINGVA